ILQAHGDASPDTITFANTVTSPITLSNGALTINGGSDLTIQGPGASTLAVSGNDVTQVFSITAPIAVSISGLTITKGSSTNDGAAIFDNGGSQGSLSLTHDTISDSTSTAAIG